MEGMGRGRLFDRWGGGFILATVLGLAVAYYIGSHWLSGDNQVANPAPNSETVNAPASMTPGAAAASAEAVVSARAYTLYAVQAGLFNQTQNAQKTVQGLQAKGFPASETRTAPFKVFAGAYASQAAAKSAVDAIRKQGFPDAFIATVNVLPPVSGNQQVQQTATALTNYLQEAAQWWDTYATGKPGAVDRLATDAKAVETAGGKLQSAAATDAAVNDLISLTSRAGQNGQELASLIQGARPEAAQVAMQDFLYLLQDYNDWAGKH